MNTIWAIIGGFLGVMVLSIVMAFVTMKYPPRSAPHNTIPPPCTCRCIRKAGAM
jgi:hypothetical protein